MFRKSDNNERRHFGYSQSKGKFLYSSWLVNLEYVADFTVFHFKYHVFGIFILNTMFLVSKCFGLEVLTQTSLINMETFYLYTKKARGRVPSKFGVSQWPDNSILDPSSVSPM